MTAYGKTLGKEMRVLVCGGRNFTDYVYLETQLNELNTSRGPITCIIHGDAGGVDQLSGRWALQNRIQQELYPADWGKYGKAVGPLRNQLMLDIATPDLVVAFPGGRGTADMVKRAIKSGVEICYAN